MRLKDRNVSIDKRYYEFTDEKGNKFGVDGRDTDWNGWMDKIIAKMENNNVVPPDNLDEWVEDFMCQRLPKSKCYYTKGIGDGISQVIHKFASIADKSAKALGVKSSLEKKARGCSSCGSRRMKLNKW
jgi:C1A family cysteine protease